MLLPDELNILTGVPLANYTSLGVGGRADYFIRIRNKPELYTILDWAEYNNFPVTVMGRGTKLLISDKGIRGVVLQMLGMDSVAPKGNTFIVEAGASLIRLANLTVSMGLKGLEWATGIPASVGGAITMNAGAFGGDMSDIVAEVEYYDGRSIKTIDVEDCLFGYRDSLFLQNPHYIITQAKLEFKPTDRDKLRAEAEQYKTRRSQIQPTGVKTAGSTFKKPSGDISAGELIEKAGLKGYTIGEAEISAVHANFIINRGKATSDDVYKLMTFTQKTVQQKFGVTLEPEIITVGEF